MYVYYIYTWKTWNFTIAIHKSLLGTVSVKGIISRDPNLGASWLCSLEKMVLDGGKQTKTDSW